MDPATLVAATQLASLAINTAQQYANGAITQDQAHAQLVAACGTVLTAIATFNSAKPAAPAG